MKRAVINEAINYRQLKRYQREYYPGTWLPEPFADHALVDIYSQVDRTYILSYALLVLMEKLNPKEQDSPKLSI